MRVHQLQLLSPSLLFSIDSFFFLQQVLDTYISFRFLLILLDLQARQNKQFVKFYFRELSLVVWPRVPERFVHLILQDGFLIVHLPLIRMIKFEYIT